MNLVVSTIKKSEKVKTSFFIIFVFLTDPHTGNESESHNPYTEILHSKFPCGVCSKTFSRLQHVKRHMAEVHGSGQYGNFFCFFGSF